MPLRTRNFMVAAGIYTLIQAAVQTLLAAFAIAQYFCYIDFLRRYPLLIYIKVLYFINPSTCNTRVNIGQSLDGVGDQAFILISRQAPSVYRTVVISSISIVLGSVWVIGSIWMIKGGARPQSSAHTHWPWTISTTLITVLDVVGIVTSYNDKNYTQTLDELVAYIGATASGLGGAQVDTSLAAKAMALVYARFGLILINLILLVYGCYDSYVSYTSDTATADSRRVPNVNVEILEKGSDRTTSSSSIEETKIPRPGLSRSFRTMKIFLFNKSGSGRASLDGGRNRQRVNFSSGHSAESILAEKQRLNLALIELACRRSPEQRLRRLASSFAQPNESATNGRRGTSVELQAQKPWSYVPAAHRMRDQLPPDEELPPVPLPDYTAFQSGRKASVHRAASSLSSITQRKDYPSYQSRQPPPPLRRELKQKSAEALVAAASPSEIPRFTHNFFPGDSDDDVPTSVYDLVTQQNTLFNSSSNKCAPRIPCPTHTITPEISVTDTSNPVQKTITLVPHKATCGFEMPRYVRKRNDGSQKPNTSYNYAANMSTMTHDITPEISVTDTTKSKHESVILVPQNLYRRFVKPPNVSTSNVSPINTAALNIRHTNTSEKYVRTPIVSKPSVRLPNFNPLDISVSEQQAIPPDTGAPLHVRHGDFNLINAKTLNVKIPHTNPHHTALNSAHCASPLYIRQEYSCPMNFRISNVSKPNVVNDTFEIKHGNVSPIKIKTLSVSEQGNAPDTVASPHVRHRDFNPINARSLNISAPNVSIQHSVNDAFEIRREDVKKQTISCQSTSKRRDVGPLNVRTWHDNPLYSTPAEVRALLRSCPVHKVSGHLDNRTNNFGEPKLNPLYNYSSENVMATRKTSPVRDFPSRNSETRTCQCKVTIPMSASMPDLHLLNANALDDGQKVDSATNVFALNVSDANVKPIVFNPLNDSDLDSIRTYRDPQNVRAQCESFRQAPTARFIPENVWNIIPLLMSKHVITYSLLALVYFGGSYLFYWFYFSQ